jgi:hypothetical protein
VGYTFTGSSKLIVLTSGTTTLDVKDMYSRWKDWLQTTPSNTGFLPAFRVIGGDSIDEGIGTMVTFYAFLTNGWRIRPQEANHKLIVSNGVLAVDGGGDPFVATLGTYNVLIQYSQPIKTETVSTGGGSSVEAIASGVWNRLESLISAPDSIGLRIKTLLDAAVSSRAVSGEAVALTPSERTALALAIWNIADEVEDGISPKVALRAMSAVLCGKVTGGPATPAFSGIGDGHERVRIVADKDGNRTAVTLNL